MPPRLNAKPPKGAPEPPVLPPEPPAFTTFTVTCTACTSTDVMLRDDRRRGSDETGVWGSIKLYCRGCGHSEDLDV